MFHILQGFLHMDVEMRWRIGKALFLYETRFQKCFNFFR
ncbi:hypothetical protein EDD64_1262 [Effusibacillus lacus]|nr:hypothetical protein EDD64_1262 [Effusibacillus lacus]